MGKAALLADKPGAEDLDNERARAFVAKALASKEREATKQSKNSSARRLVYTWGGVALALAACIAVTIFLFRPISSSTEDEGIMNGYGTPGQLLENQSVHAELGIWDSLKTESSDSLTIETVIVPKE